MSKAQWIVSIACLSTVLGGLTFIASYGWARSHEQIEPAWFASHHAAIAAIMGIVFGGIVYGVCAPGNPFYDDEC